MFPITLSEPRLDETSLQSFYQHESKTNLLSYRNNLINIKFDCCQFRYFIFQLTNNKGADQRVQMRSLVLTFVVHKYRRFEPCHQISNKVVCATIKMSDQPAHMCSLIRAFASCMKRLRILSYCLMF